MTTQEFLPRAGGRVRISLVDGSVHQGTFRTELLSADTVSAFFYGETRNISLPIHLIGTLESLEPLGSSLSDGGTIAAR